MSVFGVFLDTTGAINTPSIESGSLKLLDHSIKSFLDTFHIVNQFVTEVHRWMLNRKREQGDVTNILPEVGLHESAIGYCNHRYMQIHTIHPYSEKINGRLFGKSKWNRKFSEIWKPSNWTQPRQLTHRKYPVTHAQMLKDWAPSIMLGLHQSFAQ